MSHFSEEPLLRNSVRVSWEMEKQGSLCGCVLSVIGHLSHIALVALESYHDPIVMTIQATDDKKPC